MQKIVIILISSLIFGCKLQPYQGNDLYGEFAKLPEEEAPHFKNSLEWWYFTGHLRSKESGKEYGVEYVLFHFNPFNKRDYLMTNFAITDPEAGEFHYSYQIEKQDDFLQSKLPLGIAVDNKQLHHELVGQLGKYAIDANIPADDIVVKLSTEPAKPVLMHNSSGYENYGDYAKAGYYSYPRLTTEGTFYFNGRPEKVEGELWYDRQWNCLGVWQKEVAWDWISIQFQETKSELMIYRLHHFGDDKIVYGGTYFENDSLQASIKEGDIELEELEYWTSAKSKTTYPVKWHLEVKSLDISVDVEATVKDQELGLSFSPLHKMYYWEGMCKATGTIDEVPVSGNSYIEMTNRNAYNK